MKNKRIKNIVLFKYLIESFFIRLMPNSDIKRWQLKKVMIVYNKCNT